MKIADLLIDYRADVDTRDKRGVTPLMLCAIGNFPAIAERLIEEGISDHQDDLGMTPLHHAAYHGNLQMVFLLFENDHERWRCDMRDLLEPGRRLGLQVPPQRVCKTAAIRGQSYMDDDSYCMW